MKRYLHASVIVSLFISACSPKPKADNFTRQFLEKYRLGIVKHFQAFKIANNSKGPSDLVGIYKSFCHIKELDPAIDYKIADSRYITAKATHKDEYYYDMYYELLHFKEPSKVNSVIKEIKEKNCVDPFNLKINRIYRIGENTIITVNYLDPGLIDGFEKFLLSEVNEDTKVEITDAQ
ncbi:hypothetical protein IDJ77_21125 [Mucilaginibacter sp. ZT4R22]|uniref:Lipoprotein n=1 Tax=Mucilaginibacter pankratovii TaxID=2772110 RepID=A0ABR7WVK3_9SPHI|nr:hypothetical protein [Mucilaginibacter pankratovii]MBD1366329.1 hypothetical protein [Mucilaginibacter pankratovii]